MKKALGKTSALVYRLDMNTFFVICMFVAMLATLGVMAAGILSMAVGGDFNKKYGNSLMRARVYMQGLALGMLVLAFLTSGVSHTP